MKDGTYRRATDCGRVRPTNLSDSAVTFVPRPRPPRYTPRSERFEISGSLLEALGDRAIAEEVEVEEIIKAILMDAVQDDVRCNSIY